MLKLDDLTHLPQVEGLIAQIAAGGPGLVVVAGLDPRTAVLPRGEAGLLPSGRATIWRILMREMLDARPRQQALLVTGDPSQRLPRDLRRRVQFASWPPGKSHAEAIAEAAARGPDLLLVERLDAGSAAAALHAAAGGLRVLTQVDTVFRGAEVARFLLDLGVSRELLSALTWVVAVERTMSLFHRGLCGRRAKRPKTLNPCLSNDDSVFFRVSSVAMVPYGSARSTIWMELTRYSAPPKGRTERPSFSTSTKALTRSPSR